MMIKENVPNFVFDLKKNTCIQVVNYTMGCESKNEH
jgi:hypothetical protein